MKLLPIRLLCGCLVPALLAAAPPHGPVLRAEKVLAVEPLGSSIGGVAISPDGTRLVAGLHGGYGGSAEVLAWDARTGKQLFRNEEAHRSGVYCVAISPDGKHIASGGGDRVVRLWDVATGKKVRTLEGHASALDRKVPFGVVRVAFSGDGKRLVSAGGNFWMGREHGEARVWDAVTGRELRDLKGHTNAVPSVGISRDGTRVVTGSRDGTVRVWNADTGKELLNLRLSKEVCWYQASVAISGDGKRLVTSGKGSPAVLRDAANGKVLHTLGKGRLSSVTFSPDDKRVVGATYSEGYEGGKRASSYHRNEVKVWDAATGRELLSFEVNEKYGVRGMAMSADGKRITTVADTEVAVWELKQAR